MNTSEQLGRIWKETMRRRKLMRVALVVVTAGMGLTGCGGSARESSVAAPAADPGFGHVHGLGVNPADGLLYAATHHGVWRVSAEGKPVRVADRHQDTMGFTITGPDRFLGSGHPDPREKLPAHLGLIESQDRAQSWKPLSVIGQSRLPRS